MLQRAARNAYSWWWASHIRTKQSKWLDDNLQDMEEKVEYMLKIVDDDGDSFRQRAEMYYKQRPELISLVEESFRCYRALAERYDHLSKELQNANRTIASIYPERVELHMDEEEAGDFPGPDLSSPREPGKLHNNFPEPPKLSIPKMPVATKSPGKEPARLMSKKGVGKASTNDAGPAIVHSGLSKDEALKEIDKVQKTILAFQTEKEFVKGLYENGAAKYWEIENQITELQAQVSSLQDEFGVDAFIEDDEARTLMTTTALKSCQETLDRLQQKQKESAMAASRECQKVQDVRDKFKILKEEFQRNQTNQQSASEEQQHIAPNLETMNLEEDIETNIEGSVDVEKLRAKIKEELQVSSGDSLSASELAEKVDELVDKVIKMECEIASQNAYVQKLGSETNNLQEHLQSLQQEKDSLIENSDIKNNKIRELEEALQSIQSLKQCVADQSNNLQRNFTEASCNLDDLSEKLRNVKPDEEAGSMSNDLTDPQNFKSTKQFQVDNKQMEKEASNEQLTSCSVEHDEEFSESTRKAEDFKSRGDAPDGNPEDKNNEEVSITPCNSFEVNTDYGGPAVGLEVAEVAEALQDIQTKTELPKQADADQIDLQFDDIAATGPKMQSEGDEDTTTSQLMKQENFNELPKQPETFNPFVDDFREKDVVETDTGSDSKAHRVPSLSQDTASEKDEATLGSDSKDHRVPSLSQDTASEKDEATLTTMSKRTAPDVELGGEDAVNQGNVQETKRHDLFQKVYGDPYMKQSEFDIEDVQPNWKELFLTGLDDRETILLKEYTSILRNYKEIKMKLNEVEKKKRAGLFQHAIQVKLLRSSNAVKDAEIQSLHKKLNSEQNEKEKVPDSHQSPKEPPNVSDVQSPESNQTALEDIPQKPSFEVAVPEENNLPIEGGIAYIEENEGDIKIINVDDSHRFTTTEEKIRTDIDELLEENIEFWLRFSTSFHQIQKFQNSIQDLQAELTRLRENKKDDSQTLQLSEVRPIYRHLREIQTELSLWLDHNAVLKDDLANRLSSLSSIQEEITRLSSIGSEMDEGELSPYQAAKFQGEIMNMKQENNKIANELEAGLARVKTLQAEIHSTLKGLDEELGITSKHQTRKGKIPLRSFLFGVKLKKQTQSIFSCVTPSLQKQSSDIPT